MRIHYFQRYHQKENVATANTMLLLSRLYTHSSDKFFELLRDKFFMNSFEPGLYFGLQEKGPSSVPDAVITQESFKIVVETKITDWFYSSQLQNHLTSFENENFKLLLTLGSEEMEKTKLDDINKKLDDYNKNNNTHITHVNTTFENLANYIEEYIDDYDYEMKAILEDYKEYCYDDNLIPESDAWKFLRMQLAGTTFEFNKSNNVYYDNVDRGFRPHDYLGLYTQKSLRLIGKIVAQIRAVEVDGEINFVTELGELTDERKEKIKDAMDDAKSYGYDLRNYEHRYFFVDKFYDTDFKKITKRAPLGTRVFDLTEVLGREDLPDVSEIADLLKDKTWK